MTKTKHTCIFSKNEPSISVFASGSKVEIGRIALSGEYANQFMPFEEIGHGCAFSFTKSQLLEIAKQMK